MVVALRKESVDRNSLHFGANLRTQGSLSARRAWIEMLFTRGKSPAGKSLSARRAWIEIWAWPAYRPAACRVALRKESVDRNEWSGLQGPSYPQSLSARRAWIEIEMGVPIPALPQSLSARRAWIEMRILLLDTVVSNVALRKESVDRNNPIIPAKDGYIASLSARRAWIEMPYKQVGI